MQMTRKQFCTWKNVVAMSTPESKEALSENNYHIHKLEAKTTDFIQPLDFFVISKIKDV